MEAVYSMDSFIGQMETPPTRPWSAKGSAGGGRHAPFPSPACGSGRGCPEDGRGQKFTRPLDGGGPGRGCAIFFGSARSCAAYTRIPKRRERQQDRETTRQRDRGKGRETTGDTVVVVTALEVRAFGTRQTPRRRRGGGWTPVVVRTGGRHGRRDEPPASSPPGTSSPGCRTGSPPPRSGMIPAASSSRDRRRRPTPGIAAVNPGWRPSRKNRNPPPERSWSRQARDGKPPALVSSPGGWIAAAALGDDSGRAVRPSLAAESDAGDRCRKSRMASAPEEPEPAAGKKPVPPSERRKAPGAGVVARRMDCRRRARG